MKCPGCGVLSGAKDRFCSQCGFSLREYGETLSAAMALFEKGAYDQAIVLLSQAASEQPDNAQIKAFWGHALYFSGKVEDAIEEYLSALNIDKSRWDAQFQLASVDFSQGRFESAVDRYTLVLNSKIQLKGNPLSFLFDGQARRLSASAWLYQGLAHKELGEGEAARRCLEKSINLDDENPLPYGILADLLMVQEDFSGAAAAYRRALDGVSEEESKIAFHNDLGVALFRAGDLDAASEEFKWVLKKDPKHSNAVYNLGVLYLKQGMHEGMEEDLRELMRSEEAEHILIGLTRSMVDVAKREARDSDVPGILGISPKIKEVLSLIRRAAAADSTVLILGENGTGKELVAKAIHEASARRSRPFVAVNCSALPENLLESELFGYEKGAFTGADAAKPGRFELAEGGTLFLDEIGDLQPSMQVKLLRVLQEKSYERLGGTSPRLANVRVIAATHQDLMEKMRLGTFREDFYYRLFVIPVQVPPLRDRVEDIPLLAEHFLKRFAAVNHKHFKSISPAAHRLLAGHTWPGNVRELENALERAVAIYDDEVLRSEYLDFSRRRPSVSSLSKGEGPDILDAQEEAERSKILNSLKNAGYRVHKAADLFGVSRATFYRKMEKHAIRLKDLN